MAFIANGRLNISQIDKSKIIEGKNGAQWINITISGNDEADNYGHDISITIARSEEERKKEIDNYYTPENEESVVVNPVYSSIEKQIRDPKKRLFEDEQKKSLIVSWSSSDIFFTLPNSSL